VGNELIKKYHYLHNQPSGSALMLGVYQDNKINGLIIFGNPVSSHIRKAVRSTTGKQVLELTRLWLSDNLPKNSESKVISIALRILKRLKPSIKWIVSYADPKAGHSGIIYQATNWVYIGLTGKTEYYIIDGQRKHTKTLNDRVRSRKNLKQIFGNRISTERTIGKHCYLYFLDKEYQKYLVKPIKPYPKNISRGSGVTSSITDLTSQEAIVKSNGVAPSYC
jgi:hypothetical protein